MLGIVKFSTLGPNISVVQSESSDGLIDGAIWGIGAMWQIGVCPVTSVANFIFGYTAWVYILTKI